jgi:transposase
MTQGKRLVFFQDESHLLWKDACGYVWGRTDSRIEVPMTNEKKRQTYYGVMNVLTGEVLLEPFAKADGKHTVAFLKKRQNRFPKQQLVLFWDGASYHQYGLTRDYLKELNQGLAEDDWRITCCVLAPYAPEQNPVEDVWLRGKRWVQEHYHQCQSFEDVKRLFVEAIDGHVFNFNKLQQYLCSQPI